MKWYKTLLLSSLITGLALFSCSSKQNEKANSEQTVKVSETKAKKADKKTTWKRYGDKIVYYDLKKIPFDSLSGEEIKIPEDLESHLFQPVVLRPNSLEKMIFAQAAKLRDKNTKLNYTPKIISKLSAKDAILLGVNVVASRLTYHDIDNDKLMRAKYGLFPVDTYFEIGKGDCNKYVESFVETFKAFKKINPNLKNIYVSNERLGGIEETRYGEEGHTWNSLVFLTKDRIILTHIDPTFYDNDSSACLEGERGYHIPENSLELIARFYQGIGNSEVSYKYYNQVYDTYSDAKQKVNILLRLAHMSSSSADKSMIDNVKRKFSELYYKCYYFTLDELPTNTERAQLLVKMSYLAGQLLDKPKMDTIRELFLKTGVKKDLDTILYWSYRVEVNTKNYKKAIDFEYQLFTEFPDSPAARHLSH